MTDAVRDDQYEIIRRGLAGMVAQVFEPYVDEVCTVELLIHAASDMQELIEGIRAIANTLGTSDDPLIRSHTSSEVCRLEDWKKRMQRDD